MLGWAEDGLIVSRAQLYILFLKQPVALQSTLCSLPPSPPTFWLSPFSPVHWGLACLHMYWLAVIQDSALKLGVPLTSLSARQGFRTRDREASGLSLNSDLTCVH
jgi:hypothetical protein